MEQKSGDKGAAKTPPSREDRLKAALKANMAKRKAQARSRADAAATKNNKKD